MIASITFGWWLIPLVITILVVLFFFYHDTGPDEFGISALIDLVFMALVIIFSWLIYLGFHIFGHII